MSKATVTMPADAPNILLITADEWPGSLLGSAGSPNVLTPTLDYLARIGTRYQRAYSECPVCIPARRSLMTGTSPRLHGDRDFQPDALMPTFPTLASVLSGCGYQCYAAGKLHVYPPRDRIGFHDVALAEEGRSQLGGIDDYEIFLADHGYAGQQFMHGLSNNDYQTRPWHLPERYHPTNWTAAELARMIRRRDPQRPGFWYLSFQAPHPPLAPLQSYLDLYSGWRFAPPVTSGWSAGNEDDLPYALRAVRAQWPPLSHEQLLAAQRAVAALCTHIDHQMRVVIGTLREEGILDNTIIVFTSDHGDMLGDHGLFAKRLFYEGSAGVPMIVVGARGEDRVAAGAVDDRIVALRDVMPTLLDLAGVPVPDTADGISMVSGTSRDYLYGEFGTGVHATRMITTDRHKLIYYATGNRLQLFDLVKDPGETQDLAAVQDCTPDRDRLVKLLVGEMYGTDRQWIANGELIGAAEPAVLPALDRGLHGVRGIHWPPPPQEEDPGRVIGAPEDPA